MAGAVREAEAFVGARSLDCVVLAIGAEAVFMAEVVFVEAAVTPCELELVADTTLDLGSVGAGLKIEADGTRGFAASA